MQRDPVAVRKLGATRRRWWRVVTAALGAAALTAGVQTINPAAAAPAADAVQRAQGEGAPVVVTLITGDQVRLVTGPDGQRSAMLIEDPSDPQPGAVTTRIGQDLAVYPLEALPYLRSGALDPQLFNVTALADHNLDDAATDELAVMATSPSSPLTTGEQADGEDSPVPGAPPAAEATTQVPALGLVGLRVDKEEARKFWAALEATDVSDGEADFRRGIGRLWLDREFEVTLDQSVVQIGAPAAYESGLDGSGVTVAVLDTGVDNEHVDVSQNVVAEQDFTGEGTTDDGYGHGTHVASIIAGSGEASGGRYHGVAPGARIMDGRVLDSSGSGSESSIIAGMQWAAAGGADIANLSLGGWPTDGTDPISAAVDALTDEYGTLFVIAAGNDGNGIPASTPGAATSALTVGSVDRADSLSYFSSGAPRMGDAAIKPEVSAPGEYIVAAQADGTELGEVVAPGYVALSGTSMATPHVAGAAALLAQQHPTWTAAELKADLVATAAPVEAAVYRAGTGRVDVAAAISTEGLQVDQGTVGFGLISWPNTDADPVVRTVTYSNAGDADVTLELAGTLREVESDQTGSVKISPATVVVPAGGSAAAEVTVNPADLGSGQWSGNLVATAADGRVLRTGMGVEVESERYSLQVTVHDLDGEAAAADYMLLNMSTGEVLSSWDATGPDGAFRVEAGTWAVVVTAFAGEQFHQTMALLTAPEVVVQSDVEVVLDMAEAKPVVLAPRDGGVTEASGYGAVARTGTTPDGETIGMAAGLVASGTSDLLVLPTQPVTTGTLNMEVATSWRVPAVAISAVNGTRMHPELLTYDSRLDGEQNLRVRLADKVRRGDVALIRSDSDAVDAQLAQAAQDGAVAAIVYGATADDYVWFAEAAPLPVIGLSSAEGAALAQAADKRKGVQIHLTGNFVPDRVYQLVRNWTDQIPAGAEVTVDRRELTATKETYHRSAAEGSAVEYVVPWTELGGLYMSQPVPVGGVRTSFLTPGLQNADFLDYGTTTDAWGNRIPLLSWDYPRPAAAAGERSNVVWMEQVVRPAATSGSSSVIREGNYLWGWTPGWTDAAGHSGYKWYSDGSSWELTSGGNQVAAGEGDYMGAELSPAQAEYQLSLHTVLNDPQWQLATQTDTVWTFVSGEVPASVGSAPLAVLSVDTDMPLRRDNSTAAHRSMTFGLDIRAPEGVADARVQSIVVETSIDGGATWHRARIHRVDGDSFEATVRHGNRADVSLRVTATRADGAAVSQTVLNAYHVR